jgi:hypothetical protein
MNLIYPSINTAKMRTVSRETNDCTVRALMAAANITYDQAHATMTKHGRKFGKGTYHDTQLKAYTEHRGELRAIFGTTKGARYRANKMENVPHVEGITLGKLLERIPMGRFVCVMTGHAFAIIDRQLADGGPLKAGTRIQAIYRFD